jgi:hypothetical protein
MAARAASKTTDKELQEAQAALLNLGPKLDTKFYGPHWLIFRAAMREYEVEKNEIDELYDKMAAIDKSTHTAELKKHVQEKCGMTAEEMQQEIDNFYARERWIRLLRVSANSSFGKCL